MVFGVLAVGGLVALLWLTPSPPSTPPPTLTPDQLARIELALHKAGFPSPKKVERDSTIVFVTLEVATIEYPWTPERMGRRAVLAVRNEMYDDDVGQNFVVSLLGPPPGPGLVTVYGTARMFDGEFSWRPPSH